MTSRKRWLGRTALTLVLLIAAFQGMSLMLRLGRIHQALRSRLEAAFGRPVDVSSFGLSLLGGPSLDANYITVAEDPRFGNEFFLRADRLRASPDWSAVLRGHLRFSKFSLSRVSLNLVRAPEGNWNLERWLESRAAQGSAFSASSRGAESAGKIVLEAGRINFKRGADKQPFALVDLEGTLEPEGGGRWRIGCESRLYRAGLALQEAGTVALLGHFPEAGALAPLLEASAGRPPILPLEFDIAWRQASLSDVLRIATGQDYGVRGSLEGSLSVRGPSAPAPGVREPPQPTDRWRFSAALRLNGVHRWDLPLRADNPAVNVAVEGSASVDRSTWELQKISFEAPRSNLRANGVYSSARREENYFRLLSSSIHLDDLFAWYRAFHPGMSEQLSLDGFLGADFELAGWPLHIERGVLVTDGARAVVPGVRGGIRAGSGVLRIGPEGAELSPLTVAVGEAGGSFRLAGRAERGAGFAFVADFEGEIARVEDLFAAADALGWVFTPGLRNPLRAEGALKTKLRWSGTLRPWTAHVAGTTDLADFIVRGGALREPLTITMARIEFQPQRRVVQIAAAQIFGARWSGTLLAGTLAGPWEFALSADRLNIGQLAGWFPAARAESLLERVLSSPAAPAVASWPEFLRARGTIHVGELNLGRLALRHLEGELTLGDRRMEFTTARAEFYGGRASGSLQADFSAAPHYLAEAELRGVNLAALSSVGITWKNCCAGTASGSFQVSARGIGRDALFASLEGNGSAEVRAARLLTLDLRSSLGAAASRPGTTPFRAATARFTFSSKQTRLEEITLSEASGGVATGKGSVSFSGALDLELAVSAPARPHSSPATPERTGEQRVSIVGTMNDPQLARIPPANPPR